MFTYLNICFRLSQSHYQPIWHKEYSKDEINVPQMNFILYYVTQRVAEVIMFLTRQSVSPVFLVSETPLNRSAAFSENFVVVKDIPYRCAYLHEILIHFFLGVTPFLNIEIWPKWKKLLKQCVSGTIHRKWWFIFYWKLNWRRIQFLLLYV